MNTRQSTGVRRWLGMSVLIIAAIAIGWYAGSRVGEDTPEEADLASQFEGEVYRDIAGRVIQVAPEDGVITLDHEEIPGFMAAMRMDLQVADPAELESLQPGDDILFDLAFMGDTWKALRFRPATQGAPQQPQTTSPATNPLGRGDLVPDLTLFDATGRTFRLREMPGRHKVITFFYARCPLDNYCPAQSRRLKGLQETIEANGSDVHLVSLTLDAEHDGPEILAGYAERFAADPARWTLAGSDDANAIRDFATRMGAQVHRRDGSFQIDHALIGVRVDNQRIVDFVYGLDAIEQLVQGI